MTELLTTLNHCKEIQLHVIVTGMHLMTMLGRSYNEVKKNKFNLHCVNATFSKGNVYFTAKFMTRFGDLLQRLNITSLILLGDRPEMHAAATVAVYQGIKIYHIHGGELSGNIDNKLRHSITMLSDIHLCATALSKSRIIAMGKKSCSVFHVGAPGVSNIYKNIKPKRTKWENTIVVVYHPESGCSSITETEMDIIIEAVLETRLHIIVIYPNSDPGYIGIIRSIESHASNNKITIKKNIPHEDFLNLINRCVALVGNSSSGIIEAPSFKTPVINIGSRQNMRERAINIIDVKCNKSEIKQALRQALFDKSFLRKISSSCCNPYYKDNTIQAIKEIILEEEFG